MVEGKEKKEPERRESKANFRQGNFILGPSGGEVHRLRGPVRPVVLASRKNLLLQKRQCQVSGGQALQFV